MKLSQLRHLLAVAEAGTVRQGSKNLCLSQSSVTKSIQQLEASLGVELLHRASHGVTPTVAGRSLIARAKVIEAELRAARNDIETVRCAGSGEIRVSASPTVAMALLPKAILGFTRTRPKVSFQIQEGVYPDVLPAVRTGELDFAICLVPERPRDEELNFEMLLTDRLTPAVRSAHPLAKKGKLRLADLLDPKLEWVIYRRSHGGRNVFEQTFISAGLEPPKGVIECTSFVCVLALVENGDYVTLIPPQLFDDKPKKTSITPLVMDLPVPPWNVAVISRAQHELSPVCLAFLKHLRRSSSEPWLPQGAGRKP
jgi:DNA-binding transcriptional LysR family regulator